MRHHCCEDPTSLLAPDLVSNRQDGARCTHPFE